MAGRGGAVLTDEYHEVAADALAAITLQTADAERPVDGLGILCLVNESRRRFSGRVSTDILATAIARHMGCERTLTHFHLAECALALLESLSLVQRTRTRP